MAGISDDRLLEIADKIGNDPKLTKLSMKLEFGKQEADHFCSLNRDDDRVGSKGTREMLSSWKKSVMRKDQKPKLKAALEDSGLAEIAEIIGKRKKREVKTERRGKSFLEDGLKEKKPKKRPSAETTIRSPSAMIETQTTPNAGEQKGKRRRITFEESLIKSKKDLEKEMNEVTKLEKELKKKKENVEKLRTEVKKKEEQRDTKRKKEIQSQIEKLKEEFGTLDSKPKD